MQLGNFVREVGRVQYNKVSVGRLPIILGIVFGVALPIILILIILCRLRRQNKLRRIKRRNRYDTRASNDYVEDQVERMSAQEVRHLRPEQIPLRAQITNEDELNEEQDRPPPVPERGRSKLHTPDSQDSAIEREGRMTGDETETEDEKDRQSNRTDDTNESREENGNISKVKADGPHFLANLFNNIEDENLRKTVEEVLIPKDQIELGRVLGKGWYKPFCNPK